MATWLETVTSKNALALWRLDELPGATVIADVIGGYHGTYYAEAEIGIASPIETDPSSLAVGQRVGKIPAPSGHDLDVRDDLGWGGWAYNEGGNSPRTMLCRNGHWSLSGSNMLGLSAGEAAVARIRVNGVTYDLSSNVLPIGTWYYLFLTINGSVARLHVNGNLVDEETTLGAGGIQIGGTTQHYYLGAMQSDEGVWWGAGTDEVSIHSPAPSAADILEMYESARNTLPMFATLTGRSSVVLDSTPPPVYAPFPYSHDFNSPIIERLSRPTEVIEAVDGTEERASQATKTRRTLTHSVAIMDARARRQLAGILNNNQGKPIAWPITQDEIPLSAAITATDTVIPDLDTEFRDFDPDGRALIFTSEFDFEQIEIESLDPLTTKDPIENDWPATARIVPLKLAVIDQEIQLEAHTSRLQDAKVRVDILVEEIAAAPNRITPYTPAYVYRTVEVFDSRLWGLSDYTDPLSHDSVQKSELLDARSGLFRLDSSDDEISRPGLGYKLELEGHELISKFLGWYEERAGRLAKLWVPTFQEDFDLVSMTGSTITVTNAAYEATYNLADHRRDICLVQDDGSLAFRRITAVTPSGSNEFLTVDSSVAALASTTREICFLIMSRLDADEVELAWWTDDTVSVALRFRELPHETA